MSDRHTPRMEPPVSATKEPGFRSPTAPEQNGPVNDLS